MRRVRVVVVGAGHLGQLHLAKLAALEQAELVGVVEPHPTRRAEAATRFGLAAASHCQAFAHKADAAVIAAPTAAHLELGLQALALGWHVLMEKPMATSVAQAQTLLQAAHAAGRILQIGHTERFNPAITQVLPLVQQPRYIVSERLGPFSGRSTDVDVVLDLMIHDLDIVATLVDAELTEVRAVGVSIITNAVDMASARLAFAGGAVAQLSAGRASIEPCRKLRFFTPDRYLSVDCISREVNTIRRLAPADGHSWPRITGEPIAVPAGDALALQDASFICSITHGTPTQVDGKAGLKALELAQAVKQALQAEHKPGQSA